MPGSKNQDAISRRRMLKTLGAGAVAVTLAGKIANPWTFAADANNQNAGAVSPRVEPFDLADVRLLDGPFKDAQQRDAKYLLSLEPDRLLHNFRVNAGLGAKAAVYGGWESVQTWADIRAHGHTLGHYLSAASMMYASTGSADFKTRVDYCVAELQQCQTAGKTGLICAFPDGAAPIDALIAGRRPIGVPWYTLHKIFAGLRDAHLYCQNIPALDVLVKLSDWAAAVTANMTDAQFQKMLATEHGGMNEVLADVYVLTENAKYLALAERFCHRAVLDPLWQSRDSLSGLHSNTQIPKIIGFHRLYMLTGQPRYLAAARFFWHTVVEKRSFATGGNADNEHFFPPADFERHLNSAKTMETCCSYNMLKLTRALFAADPAALYADYYERTLYNAILASQDPDSGMMTYFQSTRPGYLKIFCTPVDSFWCCTGTGIENHAKYGDSIYFKSPDALYVNTFIPSTVNWKEKGLTLTQKTNFPEEGKTALQITAESPVEFVLKIRHPSWCANATVRVNGSEVAASSTPGSYIDMKQTWKTGDLIEVDLPMTLHIEPLPGSTDRLAIVYGPIVLVGDLGDQGITPGSDLVVNERTIGTMLNEKLDIPVFTGDAAKICEKIQPIPGKPLTFQSAGLAQPQEVTLVPYYRIAHARYNMYWKLQPST